MEVGKQKIIIDFYLTYMVLINYNYMVLTMVSMLRLPGYGLPHAMDVSGPDYERRILFAGGGSLLSGLDELL